MNDTTAPLWLQVPEPSELVRRFGGAVDIPAFGGRLEVNWAPGAKVTSAGGLAHFAMFLKASGLFDRLCGDFPVHHRSNNSCSNRDILGTAVLAILLGKTRYVHIEALRHDEAARELLGLGEVHYKGAVRPAAEVLAELGLEPIRLASKEGLALLNGTQFMAANAVHALLDAEKLIALADKIGALSLDAFDGRIEPFDDEVHVVRAHPGQLQTAQAVRRWLEGSQLIAQPKKHVQDPYSFRCMPQVHGAVKDAFAFVRKVIETEINSPTDNPMVFPELDMVVSAGNFHGEPIALPMDYLCLAMAELANISERRIYRLISGARDLPSFLVANPGLNSGFMIPQYAAASVVNQNKGLCWPTSCDSIPSSQGQEDHVSMGGNSATKLVKVVDNVRRVLAIELMNAAQAIEFRRPLRTSPALEDWHAQYRKVVPFIVDDTVMSPLIEASVQFLKEQ